MSLAFTRDGSGSSERPSKRHARVGRRLRARSSRRTRQLHPAGAGARARPPGAGARRQLRRQPQRLGPGWRAARRAPVPLGRAGARLRLEPLRGGRSARRRDGGEPRRRNRRADRPARPSGPSRCCPRATGSSPSRWRSRPTAAGSSPAGSPAPSRSGTSGRARSCAGCASPGRWRRWPSRPTGGCSRSSKRPGSAATSRVEVRDLRSGRTRPHAPAPLRRGPRRSGPTGVHRRRPRPRRLDCCRGGSRVVGWDARSGAQLLRRPRSRPTFALSPDSRSIAAGTDGRPRAASSTPARGRPRGAGDQGGGCDDRPARHLARRTAARRSRGGRHRDRLGHPLAHAPRRRVPGREGPRPRGGVRARAAGC